jgi:hypothetical protein
MLGIGYFDSATEAPVHDEATTCVVCGQTIGTRPARVMMIYCTRWPLGTFVRYHADERAAMTIPICYELACLALEARHQAEQQRASIPSSFMNAFREDNPA